MNDHFERLPRILLLKTLPLNISKQTGWYQNVDWINGFRSELKTAAICEQLPWAHLLNAHTLGSVGKYWHLNWGCYFHVLPNLIDCTNFSVVARSTGNLKFGVRWNKGQAKVCYCESLCQQRNHNRAAKVKYHPKVAHGHHRYYNTCLNHLFWSLFSTAQSMRISVKFWTLCSLGNLNFFANVSHFDIHPNKIYWQYYGMNGPQVTNSVLS